MTSTRLKRLLREVDDRAGDAVGQLPLLSVSISSGVSRRADLANEVPRAEDLRNYKVCLPGDLVINRMRAFQGALGLAPENGIVSPDYSVLRAVAPVNLRWLETTMRSQHFVSEMTRLVRGIGGTDTGVVRTPRLNISDLLGLAVEVPSMDQQNAIAKYLDRETAQIDELIAEQYRLIGLLGERRLSVTASLLAGIVPETSGVRLKHVTTDVKQGWSPQCYPWPADGVETWGVLKAGAANRGTFRPEENKALPESEDPRPELVVRAGHLLVSRANTRELLGSAAVVHRDYPKLMLCDKLYAFSLDPRRAEPRFVSFVLGTRRYRDLIELQATGSSPSMQNISRADIENLPMDLPDVAAQRRVLSEIDGQTSKIDALTDAAERLTEVSQERRAALITAAVTGQIDVRSVA